MELFESLDFNTTTVRIAVGLLSLIGLIVWCRWRGSPEDQGKVRPPKVRRKEKAKRETVD